MALFIDETHKDRDVCSFLGFISCWVNIYYIIYRTCSDNRNENRKQVKLSIVNDFQNDETIIYTYFFINYLKLLNTYI
jgi:hypothetical protein